MKPAGSMRRDILLVLLGLLGAAGVNLLASLADKETVHKWRWPLTVIVLLASIAPVIWKYRLRPKQVYNLQKIAAVHVGDGEMDVLAVTDAGAVLSSTCSEKNTWSPWRAHAEARPSWDVAAVVPRQGVVEYFVLDHDGTIRMQTRNRMHRSTWQVVNISGNNGGRILRIAAASHEPGHRELFVVTDAGRTLHAWKLDGQGWARWHDSGLAGGRDVAVCSPKDGLLEHFVVDIDGAVWHRWFLDGWSDWENWGRPGSPACAVSSFRKLTDYQEVFVVGSSGDLGHRHHKGGLDWSDWLVMDIPADFVDVAGSTTSPNSLRCLAVDRKGALWLRSYDGNMNQWLDWQRVPVRQQHLA
ncbi:putative sialidase [Alloactinosynnema sp. L-07]|nr:putative sialidase [Alloactinosynnema sp. L-07]